MKGLVLDLRDNPGGLLSAAVEVADLFIATGTIVSTAGRAAPDRSREAHEENTFDGFPMAVLVNNYSASASEIVAACLQDHHRAVIVGQRTWGKGSVQNIVELEDGRSALKLTTAGYQRPSGKNIHRFPGMEEDEEWGVKPDEGFEAVLSSPELRRLREYRKEHDIARRDADYADEPGLPKYIDGQLQRALAYMDEKLGHVETKTAAK
ncbi:MAG: S41 family peptidase, partial [Planctomycetes bacterium]|nr:S41 family peptidase [Planctomycetota bacterium]